MRLLFVALILLGLTELNDAQEVVMSTEWSRWSPWSFCSGGVRVRVRACSTVRGFKCFGHNKEFQSCDESSTTTTAIPPEVDDPWTEDRQVAMKQLYADYDPVVPGGAHSSRHRVTPRPTPRPTSLPPPSPPPSPLPTPSSHLPLPPPLDFHPPLPLPHDISISSASSSAESSSESSASQPVPRPPSLAQQVASLRQEPGFQSINNRLLEKIKRVGSLNRALSAINDEAALSSPSSLPLPPSLHAVPVRHPPLTSLAPPTKPPPPPPSPSPFIQPNEAPLSVNELQKQIEEKEETTKGKASEEPIAVPKIQAPRVEAKKTIVPKIEETTKKEELESFEHVETDEEYVEEYEEPTEGRDGRRNERKEQRTTEKKKQIGREPFSGELRLEETTKRTTTEKRKESRTTRTTTTTTAATTRERELIRGTIVEKGGRRITTTEATVDDPFEEDEETTQTSVLEPKRKPSSAETSPAKKRTDYRNALQHVQNVIDTLEAEEARRRKTAERLTAVQQAHLKRSRQLREQLRKLIKEEEATTIPPPPPEEEASTIPPPPPLIDDDTMRALNWMMNNISSQLGDVNKQPNDIARYTKLDLHPKRVRVLSASSKVGGRIPSSRLVEEWSSWSNWSSCVCGWQLRKKVCISSPTGCPPEPHYERRPCVGGSCRDKPRNA